VIVFRPLKRRPGAIIEYEVARSPSACEEKGITTEADAGGQGLPRREGLQPRLRRPSAASRDRLEDPLAEEVLRGTWGEDGVHLMVSLVDNKLEFEPGERPPELQKPKKEDSRKEPEEQPAASGDDDAQ
jgi:hypothetical protein